MGRWKVEKCNGEYRLQDSKTGEFYVDIVAEPPVLVEISRLLNTLDLKNQRCSKSVKKLSKRNCDLERQVHALLKFADPVEVNRYWESLTNE